MESIPCKICTGKTALIYTTPACAREEIEAFSSYDVSISGFLHDQAKGRVGYGSADQVLSILDLDSVSFVTLDNSPPLFRILICKIRMNILISIPLWLKSMKKMLRFQSILKLTKRFTNISHDVRDLHRGKLMHVNRKGRTSS